jgi:nucleotidyltransferase substrate binding protein (TIGR01987 family)
MTADVRWRQRLTNFTRALSLLGEPFASDIARLSNLEKEGVVQRFEFTLELAWKTLHDYLSFSGIEVFPVTPRAVVKAAFGAGILSEGQVWIDMIDHRNLLAHTYAETTFAEAVSAIGERYLPALEELHTWLDGRQGDA